MTKKLIKSSIDFGNEIRVARKALKLTQPQLAGASGVGVRFIVDLEHGKPTCALDKALHVAVMLGLKITNESSLHTGEK
jgi:HTH-type transcriptional regulator / antitoxin HipB